MWERVENLVKSQKSVNVRTIVKPKPLSLSAVLCLSNYKDQDSRMLAYFFDQCLADVHSIFLCGKLLNEYLWLNSEFLKYQEY